MDLCFKTDLTKILGIKINAQGSGQKNWEDITAKVSQKLGLWGLRELSFEGKRLILKVCDIANFVVCVCVSPLTRNVLRVLMRKVMTFFWGGKCEFKKRACL